LLQINPAKRWTSAQAKAHPFLTNRPFDPNWQPIEHFEALAALEKSAKESDELLPPLISHDSFDPFHKMANQGFKAESYRPYIPPDVPDKKEEVKSQSQNVYILNSQASSNKPKSKLNPKAAAFGTGTFQLPNINTELNLQNIKQGSLSEPNSARNISSLHGNKDHQNNKTYQEEKVEEFAEEQGVIQETDQVIIQEQGNSNVLDQQQQYGPGQAYRGNYNASQHEQFYPAGQYGYMGGGYNQGYSNQRQRSNSDQGASENIFFQQKKQGKQYYQGKKQGYQNYPNDQGTNQYQEQMSGNNVPDQQKQHHNNNKWSGNSGSRNKYGTKNYYPNQQDEHEERKEK